jgi:hypothetical protein
MQEEHILLKSETVMAYTLEGGGGGGEREGREYSGRYLWMCIKSQHTNISVYLLLYPMNIKHLQKYCCL